MRPRFLLLSENFAAFCMDDVARRLRPALPDRRSRGTTTLFTASDCPIVDLPAIDGWLIGTLFSKNGRDRRSVLARAEQLAIMRSGGRALIDTASGSYVAFWQGCGDEPPRALRDPSASAPAYLVSDNREWALASDIEWLVTGGLLRLAPDPAGVAQHLRFPLVPSATTCLAAAQELRPGFVTDLAEPVGSEALWHPSDIASGRKMDTADIADVIDGVVAGMRGAEPRPSLELSGGLDSSIIAAALSSGGSSYALHMVPAADDGDERRYARLVTDHFGIEMSEIPIGLADVNILERPRRLTARPTGFAHFRRLDRKLHEARIACGATLVFSGTGGDSVFGSLASTAPIIDAWYDGGVAQARSTLIDIATILEVTRWETMRHLARRLVRGATRRWTWSPDDSLLGPAGRTAVAPDSSQLAGLRPGARAYAASLLRLQTLLDGHDRFADSDIRFPLLAQPVLEACLAIPSWRWMVGGRDRAAAREAFAGRLPPAIVQRRGKGRYDTLIVRSYDRERTAIRELLLGGWLTERRLIDEAAVTVALDAPVTAGTMTHARVIQLVDAELWCRMIVDRERKAGAG